MDFLEHATFTNCIDGSFYIAHNTRPLVYIWKRSTQYLYVGTSDKFLARLGNHNVINKIEPVLPQDSIQVIGFATHEAAVDYESYLIQKKNPKYNVLGISEVEQERRVEKPQHYFIRRRQKY